ncbi:RusA family crossover junction endodeoxyribonuclease [Aurantimonas sp. VKM B-3413]|uniref:RusA family crossover junction endodeoxyribonuclease n=1 Tax=Aurantimonas sp. VKM B-3413 TaxID=2779401 RepID=UPI001E5055D6|nr:RusA family crossover junction endodeoxyribonuclease [Aurantimonas sp. VKM B-3413]MCB8838661.1 RusA family crossover junction endodeoxyribonuclease [Aurantimonas sp. VKM B-3413]
MEIEFPVEFLVFGTPLSHQATNAKAKDTWKEAIREASRSALPSPHFADEGPMAVTIFYFPSGNVHGDVDNIVKLILDALSRHVYLDDSQVERVLVQRFSNGDLPIERTTAVLQAAILAPRPVSYVRISNQPLEDVRWTPW